MPTGRKEAISFLWVLSLHDKSCQGSENLSTRVGPCKAKQEWGSRSTKEVFGGKGKGLGKIKANGLSFIDILALLIFGVVLFPNMEGLVDLAAIDAFLAFHHGKESPVVAILAMYDTFDRGCEKSSARIVCCALALYVWLVSHLFLQEGRPVYPLQGHRSCVEKGKANWDQLLASMEGRLLIGSLARRKEESGFYLHAKDVQMFP